MTKVKTNTGSMEERPNPNAVVSFNFEDGASVGTIYQGALTVHDVEAEYMSTSTLGTVCSADAIEAKRKENELIAEVDALKERLQKQTMEDQTNTGNPTLNGKNPGYLSGNGTETPVTPDNSNQDAGSG